jgi:hypothetical protein
MLDVSQYLALICAVGRVLLVVTLSIITVEQTPFRQSAKKKMLPCPMHTWVLKSLVVPCGHA